MVRPSLRAAHQRRPCAALLSPGLSSNTRRHRAPICRRSDRRRHADRGCAQEWPCRNARVASGGRLGCAGRPLKPAPVAPAERPGEADELLDELLLWALAERDGEGWDALDRLLPEELFDRLDRYAEARLSELMN